MSKLNAEEVLQAAEAAYYLNSDMIRFLLVENLALKSYLHKNNLLKPEVYKQYQAEAAQILSDKCKTQILEQLEIITRSTDASPSP